MWDYLSRHTPPQATPAVITHRVIRIRGSSGRTHRAQLRTLCACRAVPGVLRSGVEWLLVEGDEQGQQAAVWRRGGDVG